MGMASTDARTAKHLLIDEIMVEKSGHGLAHYVTSERGAGRSWRRIASAVTGLTGVDITDVTLIDWFTEAGAQ
jgi:hypothetical protein